MKTADRARERFLEHRIDISIDGTSETWELESVSVGESKMYVTYKLKRTENYERR